MALAKTGAILGLPLALQSFRSAGLEPDLYLNLVDLVDEGMTSILSTLPCS